MKNVPHTVTDAAIATIRERIETSVYPVGSLLPAQRQLSEELAISRASLREALSTLEALGMLHIRPGKGVYVNSAEAAGAHAWCAELDEAAQLDCAFHMRIVSLAGNTAIESILRGSADIMKESQRLPFYRRELVLSTYHEHLAIVEALKARDSEQAGRAIEAHIVNAAQRAGVHFPIPV